MDRWTAKGLWYWWIFILVAFGLLGNGYLMFKLLFRGEYTGLIFAPLLAGSVVLLYRTLREAATMRRILNK